jgi:hypothetical protein
MPHLLMLDFQLATMAFLVISTSATQASEAWEVKKEMVADSRGAMSEVWIRAEEALGSQPLSKSQIDFNAKQKTTKIHEVLMERV